MGPAAGPISHHLSAGRTAPESEKFWSTGPHLTDVRSHTGEDQSTESAHASGPPSVTGQDGDMEATFGPGRTARTAFR